MSYNPDLHGPLRRVPLESKLNGYSVDFIYWDHRLGGREKLFYGFTIVPSNLKPSIEFDWQKHGVKVFLVDALENQREVDNLLVMVGGAAMSRYLVKVPTGNPASPYESHHIMLQPEEHALPELKIARSS
ncbi:hypothetical protein L218DRAFT_1003263 [Marasmius fiardii PR-910]|nr:hypothetical protein L218DRAFT_1003263 [Marasmius fiardii PR-910]